MPTNQQSPPNLAALQQTRQQQYDYLTDLRNRVLRHDETVTDGIVDAAITALQSTDDSIRALRTVPMPRTPVTELRAYDEVGRVGAQAEEYNEGAAWGRDGQFRSWLSDAYMWQTHNDWSASERLQRHAQRVETDVAYRGVRNAVTRGADGGGYQTRSVTSSAMAGLVPPTYLLEYAALVARNGRPLANGLNRLPLPDIGMQLILPKETTGVAVASQSTENSAVQNTDEVWANTTYNVATIAGQQQLSRQALERGYPGIDQLVFADLAGAYASQFDAQLFTGSGTSGQLLGISNAGTINTATLFGAAATVTTYYLKLAGQVNACNATTVTGPPNLVVMHPRRWSWLLAAVDTQGRPLITPGAQSPGFNALGTATQGVDVLPEEAIGPASFQPVASLQGMPVVVDANTPTTVGGGSTEDVTYLVNRLHALLFEDGDGAPTQLRFEQTLGNQLTTTLVAYGYAVVAWRYLLSIGRVGGADATGVNGTQSPTF